MKQKPLTDNGLKIGDRVKLVSEMPLRKGEMDLERKVGEVVECRDDGPIKRVPRRKTADGTGR
jgi:hypothetical protein